MFSEVIIALVAVALVQTFLVKPFGVPSQSMENTLQIGDRIIVNRLDSDVTSSDVIVFGHGETWQSKELPPADNLLVKAVRAFGDLTGIGPSSTSYTVKRIIGLPGQKVACCTEVGAVTVDGKPLSEPYVFEDLAFVLGSTGTRQGAGMVSTQRACGRHHALRAGGRGERRPLDAPGQPREPERTPHRTRQVRMADATGFRQIHQRGSDRLADLLCGRDEGTPAGRAV